MKCKRKKSNIVKIRKIIIVIIIILLSLILMRSYINYKHESIKIEIKKSVRELLLVVELAELKDEIKFDDSETIDSIKSDGGEKLEIIDKHSNINNFNNIENLTIEDANKIIKDGQDFKVNIEGQFIEIK